MTRFVALVLLLLISAFSKPNIAAGDEAYFDDPFVTVDASEDPQSTFHIQVIVRRTYGDLKFKVLVLRKLGGNFSLLEVPIKTRTLENGLEEAWIHVVGRGELEKYAVVAMYEFVCATQKESCTAEKPIEYRRNLGRGAS